MKDTKINQMFFVNKLVDKDYEFTHHFRRGFLGDIAFLQKVYASAEFEENRDELDRFSFKEFFFLSEEDKKDLLHWWRREWMNQRSVGYARNDNGRRMDRVRHIRNAQLLKLSRRDSILNREFKKLCSR